MPLKKSGPLASAWRLVKILCRKRRFAFASWNFRILYAIDLARKINSS